MIDKDLLKILACPKCKGDLIYLENKDFLPQKEGLLCKNCRLIYPIKDDIPVMLIESALSYEGEING